MSKGRIRLVAIRTFRSNDEIGLRKVSRRGSQGRLVGDAKEPVLERLQVTKIMNHPRDWGVEVRRGRQEHHLASRLLALLGSPFARAIDQHPALVLVGNPDRHSRGPVRGH